MVNGISLSALTNTFSLIGLPAYQCEAGMYYISDEMWDFVSSITAEEFAKQLKELAILKLMAKGLSFFDRLSFQVGTFLPRIIFTNGQQYVLSVEVLSEIFQFLFDPSILLHVGMDGRWSKARNAMALVFCYIFRNNLAGSIVLCLCSTKEECELQG